MNPAIKFENSPFVLQRTLSKWKRPVIEVNGQKKTLPRRAGVTSIGAGGMNSHIILEEYLRAEAPLLNHMMVPELFLFSAMNPEALKRVVSNVLNWLGHKEESKFDDLAFTLQVGRTALPCRLAFVANSFEELSLRLQDFLVKGSFTAMHFVQDVMDSEMPPQADVLNRACETRELSLVASGWVAGGSVDWEYLWKNKAPKRIALPTYPFEKIRCWYETFEDAPNVLNPEAFRKKAHPFIGRNVSDLWHVGYETDFRMDEVLDYVYRHNNAQKVIDFVGVDAALAAIRLSCGKDIVQLLRMNIKPCVWSDVSKLNYIVTPIGDDDVDVKATWFDKNDTEYSWFDVQGSLKESSMRQKKSEPIVTGDILDQAMLEKIWNEGGLSYMLYQRVVTHLRLDEQGRGELIFEVPENRQNHHPTNITLPQELIAAIHQLGNILGHRFGLAGWADFAPVSFAQLRLFGTMQQSRKLSFNMQAQTSGLTGNIDILDADDNVLGTFEGLSFLYREASVDAIEALETKDGSIEIELENVLRREVANILKFPQEDIGCKTGFYALGFDSISLTSLTTIINELYGTKLTPALFYEVENIEQWKDSNKYILRFKRPARSIGPIKLVPKGIVKAPQNARYTSIERLKSAKSLEEAF